MNQCDAASDVEFFHFCPCFSFRDSIDLTWKLASADKDRTTRFEHMGFDDFEGFMVPRQCRFLGKTPVIERARVMLCTQP